MMVRHIAGLTALALLAVVGPGCASSKPKPAPEPEEEEIVVFEVPEDELGDAEEPIEDDGSPLGVATCDKLIAKMTECGERVQEDARPHVFRSIASVRASWRELAQTNPAALEEACVATLPLMPQALGPACPDYVWE